MIGKAAGPRLTYSCLLVEPQRYLGLLDFSTPQTEEEKTLAAEAKAEQREKLLKKKQEERLPRKRKLVRMQSHQSKKRLQLMSLIK